MWSFCVLTPKHKPPSYRIWDCPVFSTSWWWISRPIGHSQPVPCIFWESEGTVILVNNSIKIKGAQGFKLNKMKDLISYGHPGSSRVGAGLLPISDKTMVLHECLPPLVKILPEEPFCLK